MTRQVTRRTPEPHDRLTAVAANLIDKWEETPGYREGDRLIVLIHDDDVDGGVGLSGYPEGDPVVMMTDLLIHVRAVFASYGKDVSFMGLPEKGQG